MRVAMVGRAPKPQFAKRGANPTLEMIEYVRAILQKADAPVSRNHILRQLAKWGHSTNRPTLNAIIGFLGADGSVAQGSKGLIWVPQASGDLLDAIRNGNRL